MYEGVKVERSALCVSEYDYYFIHSIYLLGIFVLIDRIGRHIVRIT